MGAGATAQIVLTVDVVIPRRTGAGLEVLLIKRRKWPFEGAWALPGGKLDQTDVSLEAAAVREVLEETKVELPVETLRQLHTFSAIGRDPRGRYISALYLAPVQMTPIPVQAGDDASDAQWFPVHDLPPLAFDHAAMLSLAILCINANVFAGVILRQASERLPMVTDIQSL